MPLSAIHSAWLPRRPSWNADMPVASAVTSGCEPEAAAFSAARICDVVFANVTWFVLLAHCAHAPVAQTVSVVKPRPVARASDRVEDAKTFFVLMTDSFRNEPVADGRTTEDGMDGAPDAASTDGCVRTPHVDGDTGFTP
jgi:hypothetical protein